MINPRQSYIHPVPTPFNFLGGNNGASWLETSQSKVVGARGQDRSALQRNISGSHPLSISEGSAPSEKDNTLSQSQSARPADGAAEG